MGLTAGLSLLVQKKSFTKVTRTTIMPILIPLPPLFFLGGGGRKEGVIYIVHLFFPSTDSSTKAGFLYFLPDYKLTTEKYVEGNRALLSHGS